MRDCRQGKGVVTLAICDPRNKYTDVSRNKPQRVKLVNERYRPFMSKATRAVVADEEDTGEDETVSAPPIEDIAVDIAWLFEEGPGQEDEVSVRSKVKMARLKKNNGKRVDLNRAQPAEIKSRKVNATVLSRSEVGCGQTEDKSRVSSCPRAQKHRNNGVKLFEVSGVDMFHEKHGGEIVKKIDSRDNAIRRDDMCGEMLTSTLREVTRQVRTSTMESNAVLEETLRERRRVEEEETELCRGEKRMMMQAWMSRRKPRIRWKSERMKSRINEETREGIVSEDGRARYDERRRKYDGSRWKREDDRVKYVDVRLKHDGGRLNREDDELKHEADRGGTDVRCLTLDVKSNIHVPQPTARLEVTGLGELETVGLEDSAVLPDFLQLDRKEEREAQRRKEEREAQQRNEEREAQQRKEEREVEAQQRKEEREVQRRKEEREAQLRREEEEREAQLRREEQEREAQLRREEHKREFRLRQQEIEANKQVELKRAELGLGAPAPPQQEDRRVRERDCRSLYQMKLKVSSTTSRRSLP
ncbi:uncharacterized protein [Procambarus clarkii]|uniref:uncharacterized protein n=1 Tax=Procambarus clarkii TaxID=6728 RepID=UPI003743AB07